MDYRFPALRPAAAPGERKRSLSDKFEEDPGPGPESDRGLVRARITDTMGLSIDDWTRSNPPQKGQRPGACSIPRDDAEKGGGSPRAVALSAQGTKEGGGAADLPSQNSHNLGSRAFRGPGFPLDLVDPKGHHPSSRRSRANKSGSAYRSGKLKLDVEKDCGEGEDQKSEGRGRALRLVRGRYAWHVSWRHVTAATWGNPAEVIDWDRGAIEVGLARGKSVETAGARARIEGWKSRWQKGAVEDGKAGDGGNIFRIILCRGDSGQESLISVERKSTRCSEWAGAKDRGGKIGIDNESRGPPDRISGLGIFRMPGDFTAIALSSGVAPASLHLGRRMTGHS
ncbi:hypothetical protein KM043_010062 [Ampulex compressa]|nr:hypothetical protein KM043_010062 [Ampulex compressa]